MWAWLCSRFRQVLACTDFVIYVSLLIHTHTRIEREREREKREREQRRNHTECQAFCAKERAPVCSCPLKKTQGQSISEHGIGEDQYRYDSSITTTTATTYKIWKHSMWRKNNNLWAYDKLIVRSVEPQGDDQRTTSSCSMDYEILVCCNKQQHD